MQHSIYQITSQEEADACAWVFSSPEKFEKIYYKHPPLDPEHVRIRVLSAGLCHSDLHFCRGHWGVQSYPVSPGHEIIGEVEALGDQVTKFKIGDKVMMGPIRDSCGKCEFCLKGLTNACEQISGEEKFIYGKYWGGYSTHCQQPQSHTFLLPNNLDYKSLAPIMCAGITTFTPIDYYVKPGDKVAVLGLGGLGHFALQFCKKMGCSVDIFSSSHKKDELCKKLGADEIIIWTEDEHIKIPSKYNVIINTLSCPLQEEKFRGLLKCLKPYGTWIQVSIPDYGLGKITFEPNDIVARNIKICGSLVGGVEHYQKMLDFVAEHGIECYVEHFDFENFDKAFDRLENGNPFFRCVVDTEKFTFKK